MLKITVMDQSDIDFAISMTDHEKWAYLPEDFRRLILLTPEGCFVAWDKNLRTAMVTSVLYDNYAFIGTLIVREDYRGKRIGETLMRHTIDYLHGRGISAIELDGVFPAISLYRRLKFRDKYLSLRFIRFASANHVEKREHCRTTLEELIDFDREMTGIDRSRLLSRYFDEFKDTLVVCRENGLSAYAFVRPRAGGLYAIAPFIAAHSSAAESILSRIIERYGSSPVVIGVPEVNRKSVRMLLNNGFVYNQPSVRMYLGDRREYEDQMYGIISAEKG